MEETSKMSLDDLVASDADDTAEVKGKMAKMMWLLKGEIIPWKGMLGKSIQFLDLTPLKITMEHKK